jgi:fused signal recognition particle receptor
MLEFILIAVALVVVAGVGVVAFVLPRSRGGAVRLDDADPTRTDVPPRTPTSRAPATDATPRAPPAAATIDPAAPSTAPADEPAQTAAPSTAPADEPIEFIDDLSAFDEFDELVPAAPRPELDVPEPTAGRLHRLRARLARSQSSLGRGLLSVLSRDKLDEQAWEDVEETLLVADVGVRATGEIVQRLRVRTQVLGTRSQGELRALLADELVAALQPGMDRTLRTVSSGAGPAVVLVVGVNGTGKTTTCGKLARVLVADGRTVLLGAADTFRAAAADQLQTWGARVGAETIRGPEGGDPASVAFDTVKAGAAAGVDTVVIDTAGRLHTKVGLMDELGKVKRVLEKHGPIDETLLVLDATTGQNGLVQARVFTEVAEVSGVVLTKLDGTAKGGIVISVQNELGVPVKLIGLGEGADDLAPFEPEAFVDALLGDATN